MLTTFTDIEGSVMQTPAAFKKHPEMQLEHETEEQAKQLSERQA